MLISNIGEQEEQYSNEESKGDLIVNPSFFR
jgi:hypothetical protein